MTTSNRLFRNSWPIYMATAQSPIFLLLSISQLFMYCKSTGYFTTGNRLHNCLLSIEKLYDKFKSPICIEKFHVNFKSPIWKYFDHSNGYCAKPNFYATAHLLFSYFEYPYYFSTANRAIISTLQIV